MKIFSFPVIIAVLIAGSQSALAQDADKGKTIFAQCTACHDLDSNSVGPALAGVVGRGAGSASGYSYSKLMQAAGKAGLIWTRETLTDYLKNPSAYLAHYLEDREDAAPGMSRMMFMLTSEQQRKDVVAFLATQTKR